MAQPLVLLAFANEESRFLTKLKNESQAIYSLLLQLKKKGFVDIARDESTTIQSLSELLIHFHKQIVIFHFAGHANVEQLMFENKATQAQGLAGLLAAEKQLVLVFLNGCATLAQAKLLLDQGIPAVIATSLPVEDGKAKSFSETFYKGLVADLTIQEAFNHAVNLIKTTYAEYAELKNTNISTNRSIDLSIDAVAEDFPWQLMVQEDRAMELLTWKLSAAQLENSNESPSSSNKKPPKLFLMYDRADSREVEKLKKFLFLMERNQEVSIFDMHNHVALGAEKDLIIREHLEEATFVLCLITFNFIFSTYALAEEAKSLDKRMIPIQINVADLDGTFFPTLRMLPSNNQPIATWRNEDAAYMDVVGALRRALKAFALK